MIKNDKTCVSVILCCCIAVLLSATRIEPGSPAYEANALTTTPRVLKTKSVKKLTTPGTDPGPPAYEANTLSTTTRVHMVELHTERCYI